MTVSERQGPIVGETSRILPLVPTLPALEGLLRHPARSQGITGCILPDRPARPDRRAGVHGERSDRHCAGADEGVRSLITGARGPGGFSPPVTDPRSRNRLWRWSDVARWCMKHLGEDLANQGDEELAAFTAGPELRHDRRRRAPPESSQA